jgi:RNA polymerase sigma factor (sigma-70 family)
MREAAGRHEGLAVTSNSRSVLTQAIHVLFEEGTLAGLTDRQLLERFVTKANEAAFAALVARHGAMVLSVCEAVLDDSHDAEDAFQASFLILAKKSRSIRHPEQLANWLYGVARRTAQKARERRARIRRRETAEGAMSKAAVVDCRPEHALSHREEIAALHDEVDRLPQSLRTPIVLCYVEGLTHDEAARRLRWPRRGLAFGAIATAIETRRAAMAALPQALAGSTARSAIALATGGAPGPVSPVVLTLMAQVQSAMFVTRLKQTVATAFAALCVATAAAGIVAVEKATNPAQTDVNQPARQSPAKKAPPAGEIAQRARELIYFFRNYHIFSRDEQWAQTVRELATIGNAAVPELIAELDHTDRDVTIRSLAFTLRAIHRTFSTAMRS